MYFVLVGNVIHYIFFLSPYVCYLVLFCCLSGAESPLANEKEANFSLFTAAPPCDYTIHVLFARSKC